MAENKIVIFDLDDTLFDRWGQLDETYKNLPNIQLFPDTIPVLKSIKFPKILVTFGDSAIQKKKIDILGIQHYFTEIYIFNSLEEKKEYFQCLMKKYYIKTPKNVFVVGDRLDSEIRFGKELGFVTIRLLHGKYKDLKPKDVFELPDYTIEKISDVLRIVT